MPLLTNASDLTAIAAAMNAEAQASEQFGGFDITLASGDLIPGAGGSVTDAAGNEYTLPFVGGVFEGSPMGRVFINGVEAEDRGGGFVDAIRIVKGEAFFENAKGLGWSNADVNIGNNIGVGDASGVTPPVVVAEPPAIIPDTPPVVTAENPPAPSDVVHALFHHVHHHHEHRINFVREATDDTAAQGDISASANVSSVNPAVVAALGASAVADITAVGATDIPTDANIPAAGGDDLVSHHINIVDTSMASLSQRFTKPHSAEDEGNCPAPL